jgi:3-isopropylmalate/(R)-2-methylmalate dehydratase small subunit
MSPFTIHSGLVAPLKRSNVDTDQIIPKQFLKRIERTGFGQYLFYDWRFSPDGQPNSDFILNQAPYTASSILLAKENFGCGSSREHAPWALSDFGFRVIIAPSFADIFANNCVQNGLLLVSLDEASVDRLFAMADADPLLTLTVSLEDQTVKSADGQFDAAFAISAETRRKLLLGLDAIGETLLLQDAIAAFEATHPVPSTTLAAQA